jgi:uncharacterized SAM-binding protein YcdF (DUF218 family)
VKRPFRRRLLRLTCLAIVACMLTVAIAPGVVLPPLARFLDVSEAVRPVDYVLVLNGDPETRPFAAAALVNANYAHCVLLTRQELTLESASVQDGETPSELEITRRVLRRRGVPDDAIEVLPGEIGGTADEARALAAFLEGEPDAKVAVVTNSFHTRRARLVFNRALGARAGQVYFVGVPREGAEEASWWRTPHGCTVYLSEYAKLPYYWLRY